MRITLKCFILTVFTCFQLHTYGQLTLEDINLDQIHQKKIRKYVECQKKEGKCQICDIHPSWNSGMDLSSFRKNEMNFILNGSIQEIWKGYLSSNLPKSWNKGKISLGLLLRKFPGNIFYHQDQAMGVDTGQVYFLNLRIMLGILNIPVAFEIISLDPESKTIEFSYIEGNKSLGVQQVKFIDAGGERTEIEHTSYFKSDSRFRDKWLYPFFHRILVNDFHRNMKRLLNQEHILIASAH